ncbi:glycoside hydrolase clan GH-D [Beutenbergia cavernae DSM 12333]|uniref:Alpha-galactosidase n=1 Tax=Beutenbergia cavernae (strain ATCC BAA-8 / DSM 12333 / CCUG 43141 / JCM 11478 / NBRC 16432 / NCIMB 13614 / HKI 0122) TaxID=471853 RepID=C5BYG1_BEUC1|nr:alpha-galactosidase [Beutenbergia cavernae]ACQ81061.1 glycoside hydrolase clan GH-D [Beutenbergia cavernae DSM 12333]
MSRVVSHPAPSDVPDAVQLSAGGTGVVLDLAGGRLPRVLHWGRDVGRLPPTEIDDLRRASVPPQVSGWVDVDVPLGLLPEQSAGWLGTPGLTGHRAGRDFSTAFVTTAVDVTEPADDPTIAHRVRVSARDAVADLDLELDLELTRSGVLRLRARVTNTGDDVFDLATLDLALPVPTEAAELLDLTGRHLRERSMQRGPFTLGTHLRESRRAAGHDASLVLAAGEPGFGWRHGDVWGVHVAWSGNTRTYAERTNHGESFLAGGELLLAGEVRLHRGERYETPWLYASRGTGLDDLAARFHDFLRARPEHPRSPRPVTLNVWEAVYFDHDLPRLLELARIAADVGVERYVLDDGWFRHRRNDSAGLGDWYVDEGVWPDGLAPIVDAVHELGMQFGLWFEPEMINPDSDLARAHPEWIMAPGDRLPVPARRQQVLNLSIPEAYEHVRSRMLAILDEYRIDYIKWDHNRPLVEAATRATGQPAVHAQTLATYRLIDELKAAHPGLEIESCSGGGGRADLGILARTDRIWASDCIDPLERQQIEAGTSLLLPPELVGSHVASPVSHTTGRSHSLDFRAGTAFFSHLGIEWDVTKADDADRARLAAWVATHQAHRHLLHTGRVVHADQPNPALWVHGVVAADAAEAIFAVVALATGVASPPGRVRIPGLAPDARYRVAPLPPGDYDDPRVRWHQPSWWADGVTLAGVVLAEVGIQVPALLPEQQALLHLERV